MANRLVRLVVLASLALPTLAAAQADSGTPIPRATSYHFASRVLGESRVIDVALPAGYERDSTQRYPVLVVLDGEFEHEIAASIARFYATMSQLPPLIVVGIRNTDRNHDFTPAPVAGFDAPPEAQRPGGAAAFLSFISDELVPWIDRSYRTAPLRVLVGHSLGGLFALYTIAQRPDLFTGYLIMEPSAWWNSGAEWRAARARLATPATRRARVMLVNTERMGVDTTAWGGNRPMVRHLSTSDETHASMAAAGMILGLKTMFADFLPTDWRPGTQPIAMLDRYDSLAARVGYAPPIPVDAFSKVVRMSLDSRHFDDAARALDRWEHALGASDESRSFRERLTRERASPAPASFIPLEFPTHRPSAREAAPFIGRWVSVAQADTHYVTVSAAGDTIVVHDRLQFPNGDWFEADDPVVQVTADGTLEWGLPFFRGLAALVVLKGKIQPDGTLIVAREPRGWVPREPGPEFARKERFRKDGNNHF
ncbi:MAG TPA: alpha/beta hydrolase-fold protein [Gemmatimonadales bacterium]|nr:alpha/beta hydrolase-fold protein [Gemmatimonadales bacterium]